MWRHDDIILLNSGYFIKNLNDFNSYFSGTQVRTYKDGYVFQQTTLIQTHSKNGHKLPVVFDSL